MSYNTYRGRIDPQGRLMIGTLRNMDANGTGLIQIANSGSTEAWIARFSNDASAPVLKLIKSRDTAIGRSLVVANGDTLGTIAFNGDNGLNYTNTAATISVQVDGAPGLNDMPGRIVFATTADGGSSSTERMRIDSSGNVGIGTTSPTATLTVSGTTLFTGTVTVSGTTVFGSGTAAAPSISISGDSNTGLYSPGADQLSITTSGVEKFRIDSFDGNPLIETTYPTVLPSLDLNFAATKRLDPRVTFSRSSSGTYYDAAGVLQSAATDVARFDHNPSTGESLGLLVEEARTNLWNYSADPTFVAVGGSVTPYSGLAPDGTYTASTFVPSAASDSTDRYLVVPRSNTLSTQQTVTFYVKTTYSYLVFCSNGEGGQSNVTVNVGINLLTNSVYQTTSSNGTYTSSSITNVANGYKKISITYQTDGGVGGKQPGIIVSDTQFTIIGNPGRALDQTANYTTDGIKSLTIWGVQLETGSFPTSYIPTPATFTGRTSTATYYDANGVIQTALSGVARSNAYFPDSSGVMRSAGLLLEAAATNYTVNSLAGHTYNRFGISAPVTNTTETTAPDGTNTARLYIADGARNDPYIQAEVNTSSFNNYTSLTVSVYVKARTGFSGGSLRYSADPGLDNNPFIGITWNPLNYTSPTPVSSTGGTSARVEYVGNGWFRCSASYSGSNVNRTGTLQSDVQITANGTSTTNGFYVWGEQIERNFYPTSYIPTAGSTVTRSADTSTSATVTRSADVAQMTGANFSSIFPSSTSNETMFVQAASTANNLTLFALNTGGNYDWRVQREIMTTAGVGSSAVVSSGAKKVSILNGNGSNPVYVNGSLLTTISAPSGSVSRSVMSIGVSDGRYLNGTISRLTYWNTRLSDATLQTITK